VHVVPGYHRSNSDYPATCRGRPEGDPLGERSASHPFCSGPIPFSLPFRFGVPSFRPSSRPAASPRDDSVLLSGRDRDHFPDRLEVLFLGPKRDPLVVVHPGPLASNSGMRMTGSYAAPAFLGVSAAVSRTTLHIRFVNCHTA